MKKLIILGLMLLFAAPVIANEFENAETSINMTPSRSFSGYNNNSIRSTYPKLNTNYSDLSQQRREIMRAKSVTEMGKITPANTDNSPINFGQFPQKMDSTNMMHIQSIQNGVQNMYMGF